MSYQVLARKWRPKKFQDVVGQEHITRSLQNALLRERLGHAYIMTGTRGIGKTSVARLFAKALRCENPSSDANPCGECMSCQDFDTSSSMNVLEIDGASNNSVDDIRDLIGNVQYLPTSGKYKVYIIDEVHMLSTSAFNALLKTLEEPPAHAIFILATTEPEKLLGTVLSRCQRFDFRSATITDLSSHISRIADAEGIVFEQEKLIKQIAACGKGSFRDTLSLLDQVLSFSDDNKISEETLAVSLGLARSSAIKDITTSLLMGDVKACSSLYKKLIHENISPKNILLSLLDNIFEVIEKIDSPNELYQNEIVSENTLDDLSASETFWVYEVLAKDANWALESIDPEKVVDIMIQKVASRRDFLTTSSTTAKSSTVDLKKKSEQLVEEPKPIKIHIPEPDAPAEVVVQTITEPEQKAEPEVKSESSEDTEAELKPNYPKTWDGFLDYLRELSPASASNLEQGNLLSPLYIEDKKVHVHLGFSLSGKVFLDYLEEKEVQAKLVKVMAEFFETDEEESKLELSYVDEKAKEESNFLSKAEIKQKEEDDLLSEKEDEMRNDPLLQEAESLFNTKIDKVVIPK